MAATIQSSFTRGEFSPLLYGRVDAAAYQVGLRTALNLIIHASGGASNRPGLEFVGPQKEHGYAARLKRFQFKTTDTHMLEFGARYMRVIRGDGYITETAQAITGLTSANPGVVTIAAHGYANGDEVVLAGIVGMTELNGRRVRVLNVTANTFELADQATNVGIDTTGFTAYSSGGTAAKIFEIVTPYAAADLATLKFVQSADVLTITHPSYAPRELSRLGLTNWLLQEIDFLPSQDHPGDISATQNGAAGTTVYRYAVTAIAEETLEESLSALGAVDLTGCTATATNPVVVTNAAHGLANGDEIEASGFTEMTELNGRRFRVSAAAANTFALAGEDGTSYAAETTGGTITAAYAKITNGNATLTVANNVSLAWGEVAGAQRYAVYKDENGLFGLLGETETNAYTDDGSIDPPNLDSTSPRIREPFRGEGNFPAAVTYYQQRRIFGGSANRPDTTDLSRTADHSNFTAATPTRADDAIRATLTSNEVNEIRHFVPLDDLLIFTSGEEWRLGAGENQRLSADTLQQNPQSAWGSGHQAPIRIGRVVLFVQDPGSVVRSIGFEFSVDGYTGSDLTLLANHLFETHGIADWAAARIPPDAIVFLVREDGAAATMTFHEEQQVIAWTRWATRTPDKFEAVDTVRANPTDIDETAFFVVKRTIGGNTVRYIEKLHSRRFTDPRDAFFVDSGLSFDAPLAISAVQLTNPVVLTIPAGHGLVADDEVDISDIVWVPDVDSVSTETQPDQLDGRFVVKTAGATTIELKTGAGADVDATAFNAYVEGGFVRKAASTLTGFHHLAGESVIALADGNVIRGLTVSATGALTLPRTFSRVHAGLSYVADLETLDIMTAGSALSGTGDRLQGTLKNVHKAVVRFARSRGLWIGATAADLAEVPQRLDEAYGDPTALLTGDIEVTLQPGWNTNGRLLARQRDPLPMTILAIVPKFEAEGQREE